MNERENMMKKVQMYGFAAVEAAEFLDTHPHDEKAKEYLANMKEMCKKAESEYVEKYGPITHTDAAKCDGWQWIKSPWPWMNKEADK